jgi:hypothetical protein
VVLDGVDDGPDDCSDGESELDERGLEGAESVAVGQTESDVSISCDSLLSKGLRYTRLEKEKQSPG